MNHNSVFIYTKQFQDYKFSSEHPFNQLRIELTFDLLSKLNSFKPNQVVEPRIATDDELRFIHDHNYINAVKSAGKGDISLDNALMYGLGTEDTPIFENMHEASALIVGGTLKAVEMVMEEKALHALNIGGGLHHGFSGKASGFCIYNDSSIAIKYIIKKYKKRVLYVDTDAHHGDGVQWSFYDTSDACTLSIHETGRYLFPGTGNVGERGTDNGFGYSFNIPVDAFTEDDSWLAAYNTSIREVARFYKPDVLITQNGVDSHYYDPLTHLYLSNRAYREIPRIAHEIAHEYTGGKWIAVGGGGYDIWRVVPRAWSFIWLEMNELQHLAEDKLPKEWIEKWQEQAPVKLADTFDDIEDMYPQVPRKQEITEKNYQALTKALEPIFNNSLKRKI